MTVDIFMKTLVLFNYWLLTHWSWTKFSRGM